jgi:hypothetical protein
MKNLILILFVFIIGCSSDNCDLYDSTLEPPIFPTNTVISVWVDEGFSKEELIEINNSLLEWNITFNGARVLSVVNWSLEHTDKNFSIITKNKDLLILRISSTELGDKYLPGLIGFVSPSYGGKTVYLISDLINADTIFGVLLHELGHVFGASHSDSGLMQPLYSKEDTTCVDYWTALQVQRAMNIEPGIMEPCF